MRPASFYVSVQASNQRNALYSSGVFRAAGVGGVGVLPGSLPSGQTLHWAGKTKRQGQAGRRVSWDMQGGVRHCSTETMML